MDPFAEYAFTATTKHATRGVRKSLYTRTTTRNKQQTNNAEKTVAEKGRKCTIQAFIRHRDKVHHTFLENKGKRKE